MRKRRLPGSIAAYLVPSAASLVAPGRVMSRPIARYGVTLVACGLALACWLVFERRLEPSPFPLFLVAIMVSATFGGVGPAVLGCAIGDASILVFHLTPKPSLAIDDSSQVIQLAVFTCSALFIAAVVAALRQAQVTTLEALAAYRQSQAEKETILSTMAHDLRNPLSTIKGWAYMQRRRLEGMPGPESERVQVAAARINEAADRMAVVIDELQALFRSGAGMRDGAELAPCDLVGLVRQIVAEYSDTSDRHRIVLGAPQSDLMVGCDPAAIRRVLENLLANALKYSPDGGEIRVCAASDETSLWAVITVSDEGVGIPESDIPRVLEPLYRASNVSQTVAGSGLGLTGARRIVEGHGGTIEVESRLGSGTAVTVRLPLLHARDETSTE